MNPLSLLRTLERGFLVSVFLTMVALFFANIVVRTLAPQFASDLAWTEEAVRLLNLFLVFGGLGLALERGRHVSIDSMRDKLPLPLRTALYRLIDLIGLLASLYMAYLSWKLVVFVLATGQRSPTLDIPMGWIYSAPLAGFFILALRYLLSLLGVSNRRITDESAMTSASTTTPTP
ncbi:TRAP transporter small permease [Granulosicoccus antarcticus]|uniref:TRAP transporter small permease protein n=1 Tax=Granulosicoccus antarcticus IMCC3135 TaxID=1192854 RepID=A0A2Z2NPE3_9GAMM|nr:TRAP transporter small permease subunit [Granulosicoccus antarcticus]ASJ71538.1 Ectoine TRAP transporter small permease protein TeaB [Granulosicoccus antarcticus IMCC3135]